MGQVMAYKFVKRLAILQNLIDYITQKMRKWPLKIDWKTVEYLSFQGLARNSSFVWLQKKKTEVKGQLEQTKMYDPGLL